MQPHDLVVWGLIILFLGIGITGFIPNGFDRSFTTGFMVTFSAMATMSIGIVMALFGWIRSLRLH